VIKPRGPEYFKATLPEFVIEKLPLPWEAVWLGALQIHVVAAALACRDAWCCGRKQRCSVRRVSTAAGRAIAGSCCSRWFLPARTSRSSPRAAALDRGFSSRARSPRHHGAGRSRSARAPLEAHRATP